MRQRRTRGQIDAVELFDDVLELVRDEFLHVTERPMWMTAVRCPLASRVIRVFARTSEPGAAS